MRSRPVRLIVLALALPVASAAAQAVAPVPVGARVRAQAPAPGRSDGWLVGTAVEVDRGRIGIREERSGQIWSVPLTTTRVEVSRGMESAQYGALAGAIGGVGAVAGFLIGRRVRGERWEPIVLPADAR